MEKRRRRTRDSRGVLGLIKDKNQRGVIVNHPNCKGHTSMRQRQRDLFEFCTSRVEVIEQALGLIDNME